MNSLNQSDIIIYVLYQSYHVGYIRTIVTNIKHSNEILFREGWNIISIALCDDEEAALKSTSKIIFTVFEKFNREIELFSTTDPLKLILKCQEKFNGCGEHFDMIILDLEMPTMHGHQVAARIRAIDQRILILFLTSHLEEVLDSFHFGASGFIPKQEMETRFEPELRIACSTIDKYRQEEMISLRVFDHCGNSGRRQVITTRISVRDITHIEAISREIFIHCGAKRLSAHAESFSSILESFEHYGFIKVYRSIAVNPAKIKRIDKRTILLVNDETIPYSRNVKKNLLDSISNYSAGEGLKW